MGRVLRLCREDGDTRGETLPPAPQRPLHLSDAEERRFITPKAIAGTCLVGEPAAIVEQLRQAEREGLREVTLLPPMASARKVLKDFADEVMRRY